MPQARIGAARRPLGATAVSARALAPDLARGAMLLLIALANAHLYLYADSIDVRGYPSPATLPDQLVVLLQMTLVDGRAYPMFAALFGYGMVQLLRRNTAGGVDPESVCGLLRRRGAWLLLFGFLHALLLFSGDILGAYGLLAILFAGVVIRTSDRMLLVMAAVWTVPAAVLGAAQGWPAPEQATSQLPSMSVTDPLLAAAPRVTEWVSLTVLVALLSLVPALLLGVWAARRRILDEPARRRGLLAGAAVIGLGLAVACGLPLALMAASWWEPAGRTGALLAGTAHTLGGFAGGVGYAAVAGLVALRTSERRGPLVTALAACGQRSLTCYLLQSVVFVALLAAYGGGLGGRLGLAETAALAAGTWALTVLVAEWMRRRGLRGPAEVALRRLTYRRLTYR